ncbi:MAG: hypothetical protein SGPRY_006353, partial [Prymnesium sp.]
MLSNVRRRGRVQADDSKAPAYHFGGFGGSRESCSDGDFKFLLTYQDHGVEPCAYKAKSLTTWFGLNMTHVLAVASVGGVKEMTDLVELRAASVWVDTLLKEGEPAGWHGHFDSVGNAASGTRNAVVMASPVRNRRFGESVCVVLCMPTSSSRTEAAQVRACVRARLLNTPRTRWTSLRKHLSRPMSVIEKRGAQEWNVLSKDGETIVEKTSWSVASKTKKDPKRALKFLLLNSMGVSRMHEEDSAAIPVLDKHKRTR